MSASVNSREKFPALRNIFQKAEINIQPALIGWCGQVTSQAYFPGLENITKRSWKILLKVENIPKGV